MSTTVTDSFEELKKRILVLNEKTWEVRLSWPKIEDWLSHFDGRVTDPETERLHALFWLSQFMYFGAREIRVLLKAVYRDLFLCPLLQEILARDGPSITNEALAMKVREELQCTRFVGVGNPSESGVHLLYFFRQENSLGKNLFIDTVRIFTRITTTTPPGKEALSDAASTPTHSIRIRDPQIKRYVFLDDICGSGDTAIDYSKEILSDLKKQMPDVHVAYYSLFATTKGLQTVRASTLFGDNCAAIYELDNSYRCLSEHSRYLKSIPDGINANTARSIAKEYGDLLDPRYATGYKDSQMLMGFHHNTPDNTLGIMWCDQTTGGKIPWSPVFKRYPKVYGE